MQYWPKKYKFDVSAIVDGGKAVTGVKHHARFLIPNCCLNRSLTSSADESIVLHKYKVTSAGNFGPEK